jgi:serine/threonine protein kinase
MVRPGFRPELCSASFKTGVSLGTLDDCLQHLRSYDSAPRKAHLSCDIGLGLAALHACRLVHGDIKPSNLIVQYHPSRSIVAKLSDFNGVSPAETYGSNPYSYGTIDWQAPEAVIREEEGIDWQLCDVYSFAMVIATIWTQTGYIPRKGCFIDTFLEYRLDKDQRRTWIQIRKLLPDNSETSLVRLALGALPGALDIPFRPRQIVAQGLSTAPANRYPMAAIVHGEFASFARETGRDIR